MNNKGFTLVELLAVIVILALITTLAGTSVTKILKDSKDDLYKSQIGLIEESAHTFIASNLDKAPNPGECVYIKLGTLKEFGVLKSDIKNPKTNKSFEDDIIIKISSETSEYGSSTFKYEVDVEEGTQCVYVQPNKVYENGEVVYFDVKEGSMCAEDEYKASYDETTQDYLNSLTEYNGITESSELQNSCLKFYAFNDERDKKTLNLILDHNTTGRVAWNLSGSNAKGPSTADNELLGKLKIDTIDWKGTIEPIDYEYISNEKSYTVDYSGYKARIITANEIAIITKNEKWNETTTSSSFYFDSLTGTASDTCKEDNASGCKYGWLYDRTSSDCTKYGCLNNTSNGVYWTVSADSNNFSYAWYVYCDGRFYSNTVSDSSNRGIRPVITILKK